MATTATKITTARSTALKRLLNQNTANITTINDLFSSNDALNKKKQKINNDNEDSLSPALSNDYEIDEQKQQQQQQEEPQQPEQQQQDDNQSYFVINNINNDIDEDDDANANNNNNNRENENSNSNYSNTNVNEIILDDCEQTLTTTTTSSTLNNDNSLVDSIKRIENNQNLLMLKMDLIIETFKYFQNNYLTKSKFKNCMKNVYFNADAADNQTVKLNGKVTNVQYNNLKLILNNEEDDDDNENSDTDNYNENEQLNDYQQPQQQQQQSINTRTKPIITSTTNRTANTTNSNINANSQFKKIFNQQQQQNDQNYSMDKNLIDQYNDYYDEQNEQSDDIAPNGNGNDNYSNYYNSNNVATPILNANLNTTMQTTTPLTPYASGRHVNNPIQYDIPNLDEAIAANYHSLDTQEIAVRLKEALSNYEISRELFGEAILNASRKVTNYILTAPKTFQQQSKLYQERYLKVKMWLDDPLRIEKIKQWKSENNLKQIKSERMLYRNNFNTATNMSNNFNISIIGNTSSLANNSNSSFKLTPILNSQNSHNNANGNNTDLNDNDLNQNQMQLDTNDFKNINDNFIDNDIDSDNFNNMNFNDINTDVTSNSDFNLPPNSQHYPYEDVQLDMNSITTEEIANQLKDVLLKYKISQRLFGQAVLNVHKNVISLLLLEPKTWATLSRQARERYVQIYAWLNDKNRFKKISDFLATQNYSNKQSGFR